MAQLFSLDHMSTKLLNNWAGLFSIAWMVGAYAFLAHAPSGFGFEPSWLFILTIFVSWLGVGLLLAVAGLRRGHLAGRVCATLALLVFLYFAWQMVSPAFIPAHRRAMWSNKSLQATRDGRSSSAIAEDVIQPRAPELWTLGIMSGSHTPMSLCTSMIASLASSDRLASGSGLSPTRNRLYASERALMSWSSLYVRTD